MLSVRGCIGRVRAFLILYLMCCVASGGFLEVHPGECHKDKCLEECYHDFEEPEGEDQESSDSRWDHRTEVRHNSDECDSGEYITEKSDRE